MRIMRTALYIAGGIGILGILGVKGCGVSTDSNPRDTPIVVGGGSVYGKTHNKDNKGWNRPTTGRSDYSASLHSDDTSTINPGGIDYLEFSGFGSGSGSPFKDTGGWVLNVFNKEKNGTENPVPALTFCSDANCRASSSPCSGTFDKRGNVSLFHRHGTLLQETNATVGSNTVIQILTFNDTEASCSTAGAMCNEVFKVTLDRCNGPQQEFSNCASSGGHQTCIVKVGKDH